MPRPLCRRKVDCVPRCSRFHTADMASDGAGPSGFLTLDEFEAIRLADLLGLYQEEAASRMGVSRATFGRILGEARRKIAEAIVMGGELQIGGGTVELTGPGRTGVCVNCRYGGSCKRYGPGTGEKNTKESGTMETKKLLIPVSEDKGLDSIPAGHFGRAPFFLLVELDGNGKVVSLKSIPNGGEHFGGCGHAHELMAGCGADFAAVYGMGPRGIEAFKQAGTKVLRSCEGTAADIVKAFVEGRLPELEGACADHCH